MKFKYLFLLIIVALWPLQGQAQNYFVSSLATPGAATFFAGQDQNGIISLPCEAGTHTIEVETNQEAIVVSCDADWCKASIKGKALKLMLKENEREEVRCADLVVHSKDFHPLIITIQQEKTDNPYKSVSNNFVRTFAERTKNMPRELVMKEQGKLNAIKKAYQLTEFPFVPTGVIEINKGYDPYLPNVEYKGMLYSSTKEIGTSVPNAVSFYTFVTAVRNPRSKLYTEHIDESPYHGTNCRAYYGTVCSSLVSYALDINYGSQDFVDSDLMEDIGYKVPEDVEVGDVLWYDTHVAIITDMQIDEEGMVQMVEVSEAVHEGSIRRRYNRKEFHKLMNGDPGHFEKAVRYKYIENNQEYEAFPEFVQVLGEEPIPIKYNDDLCVDKGDRSNYLVGEDVTINIFSPYDSVVVYKDRERYACFTKGNEYGDVTLSNLPYGTYSAYLWSNRNKTMETSWIVVDYEVSYNKGEQVIYFRSKNSTPTLVRLCSKTGRRMLSFKKLLLRYVTENERTEGRLDVPADKYYDNEHSYVQVIFKTNFGTVSTRPIKAIK